MTPIRVILAEDQGMVLGAFASLLELESDIELVATAHDGEDALHAVDEHRADVLITDIEMPGRTGLDVAAELQARGAEIRVVIVTTFARPGYLRRALEAGVAGYVLKDAPIDRLIEAVRTVAAGGRAIDPELATEVWGSGQDPLTERERELLRLVEQGWSNARIAEDIHLAEGTVRNYLSNAITKLQATNRIDAATRARERGWL